jgi:hypothetical protein
MKKLFVVVVLFLGIAVVAISFSELETIMLTLQKAHLTFFILAIIVQLLWFVTTARMYQSIFHLLGVHESTDVESSHGRKFINVVPHCGRGWPASSRQKRAGADIPLEKSPLPPPCSSCSIKPRFFAYWHWV